MGQVNAANLKPEEIEEFQLMSNCNTIIFFPLNLSSSFVVSELELKRLYRRFKKLDKDGSVLIYNSRPIYPSYGFAASNFRAPSPPMNSYRFPSSLRILFWSV